MSQPQAQLDVKNALGPQSGAKKVRRNPPLPAGSRPKKNANQFPVLNVLKVPARVFSPPKATGMVGSVRSLRSTPMSDVRLEDVIANKHLSPLSLKDFEGHLVFKEYSAENLYFILWLNEYTVSLVPSLELALRHTPLAARHSLSLASGADLSPLPPLSASTTPGRRTLPRWELCPLPIPTRTRSQTVWRRTCPATSPSLSGAASRSSSRPTPPSSSTSPPPPATKLWSMRVTLARPTTLRPRARLWSTRSTGRWRSTRATRSPTRARAAWCSASASACRSSSSASCPPSSASLATTPAPGARSGCPSSGSARP